MKRSLLLTIAFLFTLFGSGCITLSPLLDLVTIEWRCPPSYSTPRTFASNRPENSQTPKPIVSPKTESMPASKQTVQSTSIPMAKAETKPLPNKAKSMTSAQPKISQKAIEPSNKRVESKLPPHPIPVIPGYLEQDKLNRMREKIIQAYKEFRFDEVITKSTEFVIHPMASPRQTAEVSILAGASLYIQGKENQASQWFRRAIQAEPGVEPNDAVFPRPVCRLFHETTENMN